jgi:hypothetical protein
MKTTKKAEHSDTGAAGTDRNSRNESPAKEIASSGDNRRLGDQDGNRNAGDARSPGADDPAEEPPRD